VRKPYFKKQPSDPQPLKITVSRCVRYEECDPLGIVWHGRYSSYFEDARLALGNRFGIGYLDFHRNQVAAPIRKLHFDYFRPLVFAQEFSIEGILHWSEAARMNFEFILRNSQGQVTTTGYTVQMMIDEKNEYLLLQPDFYLQFCQRWKAGELT